MFNPNGQTPWHYNQNPIVVDSESDQNDDDDDESNQMQVEFPGRQQPRRGMAGYSQTRTRPHPRYTADMGSSPDRLGPSMSNYHTSIEQEKKVRSRLREERHAALCVLMDRELLTMQALAAQETLPQTRRRFLAKLLAPEDPEVAAAIRADQFQLPSSSLSSTSPYHNPNAEHMHASKAVSRSIVDVCETDDTGWYRPDAANTTATTTTTTTGGPGGGGSSGLSSPASSSKTRGKLTPDRTRNNRRVSSGRQQPRERRRRWSGAERQDHGVSLQGFPP